MNRLKKYWRDQSITQKLILAFGSILILIVIINVISFTLLYTIQKTTAETVTNANRIKNLILEISLDLEKTRQLETGFFLRYASLGYDTAYAKYILPAKENLLKLQTSTEDLGQYLEKSSEWNESRIYLKLLSLAQKRHALTVTGAVELVKSLTNNDTGLIDRWQENLDGLYHGLLNTNNQKDLELMNRVRILGSEYLRRSNRPTMQRSINTAEILRDRLTASSELSVRMKNKFLDHFKTFFQLSDSIIHHNLELQGKLHEIELQTNTIHSVTGSLIVAANREIEELQKAESRMFRVIVAIMILSILLSVVIVLLVGTLMGKSIVSNLIVLSKAVNEFEKGNYHFLIRISSSDELGMLAAGFNNMAVKLHQLIENLEQQVANRTLKLDDSNKKLKAEIAERIKSQEALKYQQELFESIVYNIPIMIAIFDPQWQMINVNKNFEEIIGWTNEELKRIDLMEKCYPDPAYRKQAVDYMNQSTSDWREFQVTAKSGKIVESIWSNIKLQNGTQIGIGLDVTERNRAEQRIKDSLAEKDILLQEIHHRVKNNMQVISSLLTLQQNSFDDPKIKGAFRDSQNRVYAMSAVHESLYGSENLSQIDFEDYIRKVTPVLAQSYSTSQAEVAISVEAEEIRLGIDQATPLGLVINELISNSMKYAFPGGTPGKITITMKKTGQDWVKLEVSDNGVGLPLGFDWQEAKTLGLKLVNSLVRNQLDGQIELELHGGTTFCIRFPLKNTP